MLSGEAAFTPTPVQRPVASLLPPAERRRCAPSVAWALAVAQEAVAQSGLDAGAFAVVFASSDGDGDIVHRLCTALATPAAAVSPTDFHNSVHNAATGYWSIGAHSQAPSTAICAYDGSFSAGLLEAACQIAIEKRPVLLVTVDLPYPPPLAPHRPVRHGFAAALALEPGAGLEVTLRRRGSRLASPEATSKATPRRLHCCCSRRSPALAKRSSACRSPSARCRSASAA